MNILYDQEYVNVLPWLWTCLIVAPFNLATAAATCSTWLGWAKSILQSILQENCTAPNYRKQDIHITWPKDFSSQQGWAGHQRQFWVQNTEHPSQGGDGWEESSLPPCADGSPWKVKANNIVKSLLYFHSLGKSDQSRQSNLAPGESVKPVRSRFYISWIRAWLFSNNLSSNWPLKQWRWIG